MYVTAPISVSGNVFTIKSPRPTSGTPPNQIQITNNSSYVFGFTTGAEQMFIDPYTRSTYPLATVTDAIIMTPVYNAYALVGAGYVAADWLLPNEPTSQADGALPISQLITQAVQSIISSDGSMGITNPNGPTVDLSAPSISKLLGIPPPTSLNTIQTYTDPLGNVWVAKNNVNNGNWVPANQGLVCRVYRVAPFTVPVAGDALLVMDTRAYDPYGIYNLTTGAITMPIAGYYQMMVQLSATCVSGQGIRVGLNHGLFPAGAVNKYNRADAGLASGTTICANASLVINTISVPDTYSVVMLAVPSTQTDRPGVAQYYWTDLSVEFLASLNS